MQGLSGSASAVGLAALLLLGVAGCSGHVVAADEGAAVAVAPAAAHPTAVPAADVVALLATLPVKGKAPKTGYNRTGKFGPAWLDVDHNGCDTRDDVLARDLADKSKSGRCRVLTGVLDDPYTGKIIHFVRGNKTSTLVQIDHVDALLEDWQTGAQQLSQARREALANDPLNLLAVDGRTNSAKGAGDAATWLPPRKAFRCAYVSRQIQVKAKYDLWVTPAERDAMVRVLGTCQRPATAAPVPVTPVVPAPTPAGAPAPPVAPVQPAPAGPLHPGAYCSPSGATGVADNGSTYTCGKKGPDTNGRFHWND